MTKKTGHEASLIHGKTIHQWWRTVQNLRGYDGPVPKLAKNAWLAGETATDYANRCYYSARAALAPAVRAPIAHNEAIGMRSVQRIKALDACRITLDGLSDHIERLRVLKALVEFYS